MTSLSLGNGCFANCAQLAWCVCFRREWHCIRAMQMFLEHIGLKYEGMIAFAKQLYEVCPSSPHPLLHPLKPLPHPLLSPPFPLHSLHHTPLHLLPSTLPSTPSPLSSIPLSLTHHLLLSHPPLHPSFPTSIDPSSSLSTPPSPPPPSCCYCLLHVCIYE